MDTSIVFYLNKIFIFLEIKTVLELSIQLSLSNKRSLAQQIQERF